jgi:hypothetical protein
MSLVVLNVLNEVVSLVLVVKQSLCLDFVLLHGDIVSIMMLLSVDLVLFVNVKWFREEHCGNTDQSDEQEENTETLLETIRTYNCNSTLVNSTSVKSHTNHIGNYWRSLVLSAWEISQPFANNHEVHVAEQDHQENNLRNKLKEEINLVLEVSCIKCFHANS